MIPLLILLILLAVAGKMFLGAALEVCGFAIGLVLVLSIFIIRRRKQK